MSRESHAKITEPLLTERTGGAEHEKKRRDLWAAA